MPEGLGYMCPKCFGYGRVFDPRYEDDGVYMDCPRCGGAGSVPEPDPPIKPQEDDDENG